MENTSKLPLVLTKEQRDFIEELLKTNQYIIRYTLRKSLGNKYGHLMEDCIGELCLLMCQKVSVLEAHPTPEAWVVVAAKLVAFSVIKRAKRYAGFIPLERVRMVGTDTTFEEVLYGIWLQNDTLQKLIERLTKREAQVYNKLYVENKSVETTAKELGLSPSTVRNYKRQ